MTFESVEDDDETETAIEAARRPLRLMRGPLTRRRERRILIALAYFGPLGEDDLYGMLHASEGTLTKALLSLTTEGLITCESRLNPFATDRRIWSMRQQQDGAR